MRLAVALAAVVTLAGCGGDDAGSAGTESPSATLAPRAQAPIEVGGTPVAIAADESGVWVVDDSGSLLRLDPQRPDGRQERIPIAGGSASIAIGEGAVWVASADGSITRVDPTTGKGARLDLRVSQPGGIAAGEGSVWVTSSAANRLVRIDPASGDVVGDPITVGEFPTDVAVGDGAVWVANTRDGSVSRVDAASGAAGTPIPVAEEQVLALALDADGVWVAKSDELLAGGIEVVRIDPSTSEVVGEPVAVDAAIPVRIAAGEGGVWTTLVGGARPLRSEQQSGVAVIDPATGQQLGQAVAVGDRPSGIATGAGGVWVANAGDGTVTRIDPKAE